MKRGLLIGGGIVGALVVVVVVAVVYVFSNLSSLIKQVVERVGSDATQAKVTLSKADVSITEGKGALGGLVVGNPQGFKTDSAFKLGAISVSIDTATVRSDPIVIKEIVIAAPEVTYELAGTGSNIDAIQKNVNAFAQRMSSGQQKEKSGEGPKVVINNLYIRDGKVNVSAGFLQGKSMGAPLPTIHLKDIGKEKKGATPGEVAQKVISSITDGATKAVAGLNLDKLKGMAGDAAGAAKKAMEGATGAAGGAAGSAGDAAKGAADKLKGLLK